MPRERQALAQVIEAAGLLAAVVAAVYVLGGIVLGIRLLFDGFSLASVIALLGQLPREFVITAGLVEGIAPAAVLGGLAALGYGLLNRPKPRRGDGDSDQLDSGSRFWLLFVFFALLAGALIAPAIWLAATTDGISLRLLYSALGFLATYAVVCAGWFLLRRIGRRRDWYRLTRAVVGGLVWAAMALIPAVMFGGASTFEDAVVCVNDETTPEEGSLVAQTDNQIVLASDNGDQEHLVSIPAERVIRLFYGETENGACPPPEAGTEP